MFSNIHYDFFSDLYFVWKCGLIVQLFESFSDMSPKLASGLIMLWAENRLCFFVFILAMLLVWSKFPKQGSNSGPLQESAES